MVFLSDHKTPWKTQLCKYSLTGMNKPGTKLQFDLTGTLSQPVREVDHIGLITPPQRICYAPQENSSYEKGNL